MIIFRIEIPEKDESYRVDDDDDDDDPYKLKYNFAVRAAFGHNRKKNDEFNNILDDYYAHDKRDLSYEEFLKRLKVRVKELLKGHTDLILGFNSFLPKKLHFQLDNTGKKLKVEDNRRSKKRVKVEEICELPWDVLNIISKTLDFDDHFQFAGVCKNWRAFHKIYRRNFLPSQEPLLLQFSTYGKGSFSFISIPDEKVYCSEMLLKFFLHNSEYVTSSNGYFIFLARDYKSFMLINPFTRTKKVIDISTCEFNSHLDYDALLAFGKCSDEFVLVVLCKYITSLHVYHSRNREWVTYSAMKSQGKVDDFVVLHDKIYVVTNKANIGVLNMNSTNIQFLKLMSTPNASLVCSFKLVNCDEQLLVVALSMMDEIINVYKIDFSTMNYVKLKTLGDIALFYATNKHFYALSNPIMWRYENNSVYVIGPSSTKYRVYLEDDKYFHKDIMLPSGPPGPGPFMFDWYFRNLRYEIDYS